MTNYAAEAAGLPGGGAITERAGTASSDAVPAGSIVLWRNTGAGSHDVTVTTNNTAAGGLAIADMVITMAAGAIKASQILNDWGDANGFCAIAIANATPSELKFYILGGI